MHPKNQQAGSSAENLHDEFLEVLRNLTHRMSQPLTSLRGSLEVALMSDVDGIECRKIFEQSVEETDRIMETLGIIRAALDAEDSGKDSERVYWNEIVAETLEELAPFIERTRTRVVLDPLPDVGVFSSPLQLAAITRELIQGCIENSPAAGELHIRLGIKGTRASLLIERLPPGNTPAAPQHQPESGPAGSREETDFSKWILRHAIRRQDGRIETEQLPTGETRYNLSLPLALPNSE